MPRINCKCPKCEQSFSQTFPYHYAGIGQMRRYCKGCYDLLFRGYDTEPETKEGDYDCLDIAEYGYDECAHTI